MPATRRGRLAARAAALNRRYAGTRSTHATHPDYPSAAGLKSTREDGFCDEQRERASRQRAAALGAGRGRRSYAAAFRRRPVRLGELALLPGRDDAERYRPDDGHIARHGHHLPQRGARARHRQHRDRARATCVADDRPIAEEPFQPARLPRHSQRRRRSGARRSVRRGGRSGAAQVPQVGRYARRHRRPDRDGGRRQSQGRRPAGRDRRAGDRRRNRQEPRFALPVRLDDRLGGERDMRESLRAGRRLERRGEGGHGRRAARRRADEHPVARQQGAVRHRVAAAKRLPLQRGRLRSRRVAELHRRRRGRRAGGAISSTPGGSRSPGPSTTA